MTYSCMYMYILLPSGKTETVQHLSPSFCLSCTLSIIHTTLSGLNCTWFNVCARNVHNSYAFHTCACMCMFVSKMYSHPCTCTCTCMYVPAQSVGVLFTVAGFVVIFLVGSYSEPNFSHAIIGIVLTGLLLQQYLSGIL